MSLGQENEFRDAFRAAFIEEPLRLFVDLDIDTYHSSDSGVFKGGFDILTSISARSKTITFEIDEYFGDMLQQSKYSNWNSYEQMEPQFPYLKEKYELLSFDYSDYISDPEFVESILIRLKDSVDENLSDIFSKLYVQDIDGKEFIVGRGATTRRHGYAFDKVKVAADIG